MEYLIIYLPITARTPDVQVAVDMLVTRASVHEERGNSYSVGIGQEFGLVCTTSSFFEVYWYQGNVLGKNVYLLY